MKLHSRLKPQDKASLELQGKPRPPVPSVSVDYIDKSGSERLEALVPIEEAERLRRTPFAAVQVRLLSPRSKALRHAKKPQRRLGSWCLMVRAVLLL